MHLSVAILVRPSHHLIHLNDRMVIWLDSCESLISSSSSSPYSFASWRTSSSESLSPRSAITLPNSTEDINLMMRMSMVGMMMVMGVTMIIKKYNDSNDEEESHPSWFLSKTLNTFWIFSWSFALLSNIKNHVKQARKPPNYIGKSKTLTLWPTDWGGGEV